MSLISTEITIDAPLEKVWNVLIDFNSYKKWNPYIQNIQGIAQVHQKLILTIVPPGKKRMLFKPIITFINEKSELQWVGKLVVQKIYDCQHSFKLKKISNDKTIFINSEKFTGVLEKLIFKFLEKSTREGFERMNHALKEICEKDNV